MIFTETNLKGAYLIELEKIEDERGFFARCWCKNEFNKHGLNAELVQCNVSFNQRKGTLRGMHYQAKPHGEAKLVRCVSGSIYDVIIDLRPESDTYKQWTGVELNSDNHRMMYVPEDFAHGFLTLKDNTEVVYQMSEIYYPDYARGIRWNDPDFTIEWPDEINVISDRDKNYPNVQLD